MGDFMNDTYRSIDEVVYPCTKNVLGLTTQTTNTRAYETRRD